MQPVMGPFYNQCTAQQADATSDRDALQPDVTCDGAAAPQPDTKMQPEMQPVKGAALQPDATSDRAALQPDVTSDGAASPQPDAVMGPLLNQRCNPRCNEW